jgi:predicted methyltransferase
MANNGIASIDISQTNNIQTTPHSTIQPGNGAAFLQSMAGIFNVSAVVTPPKVNPITINPFKGKSLDQIRAALTALVNSGQQQTAALQFEELMGADISTATETFQYYTSHIDSGTAEAIFSVMAQNNMPVTLDLFIGKLGTLQPQLQQVCADIFGKYANVRSYKNIALNAIYAQPTSICIASDSLKDDKDVVLAAVKNCFYAFQYASSRLKDDKNTVLAVVKQYGGDLKDVSTRLRNDKAVVTTAVNQAGGALQYASTTLKNDKDVVLVAVKQDGSALSYTSDTLKNDKYVVLTAVNQIGGALQYASTTLKNDKYLVSDAVKQDGLALQYASSTLKNDKDVVLAAVKQNGFAILYSSNTLINDNDIISAASIKIRGSLTNLVKYGQQQTAANQFVSLMNISFQTAVNAVQDNTSHMDYGTADAIFSVMAQNNMPDKIDNIFKQIGPSNVNQDLQAVCSDLITRYANVCSYKYIVWSGAENDGFALAFASGTLNNDKDVVMAAVTNGGENLYFASDVLKNDKDVAITAITQSSKAVKYVSPTLLKSEAFQMDIISANINAYKNQLLGELGISPASNKVTTLYNNTKAALNSLGITLYSRFSDTKEIIRNRYSVSNQDEKNKLSGLLGADYFKGVSTDTRPIAVMTAPVYDWNGAFADLSVTTHPLTKGYKLIYYEVSTDTQFVKSVKEATIDNNQKASILIIGGHGSPSVIRLGNNTNDEDYLDMSDSDLLGQLKGAVADKGNVIEYSCENGELPNGNTPGIDDIAEYLHSFWPNAYTHAAMASFVGLFIKYDKNNLLSDVSFGCANELTITPSGQDIYSV